MAMVLVTHDFGVVAGVADRVIVMRAGRIVEVGPTAKSAHATRECLHLLLRRFPGLMRALRESTAVSSADLLSAS